MAITTYSIEDQSFPRTFELVPCPMKLNQMRLLKNKLNLVYKSKIKRQPQELFDRQKSITTFYLTTHQRKTENH
ncbi:unnamed protein product [Macrosiphum euphorbiae]|uniref:Uncharacterized protein n=1 Tax=Macrosiphum euphorbiae TaxID=13131 RepID=A0AAV0XRF9_9HEMI|nr:unnamed protein product [Macrosiphum euphorbiae]